MDVALDRTLRQTTLSELDRALVTELVYGCVRRQRTLDALIDQLAKRKAQQQSPDLRRILHLGFYQLRYFNHIPPAAVVTTTVDLAKCNQLQGLAGFVNGLLRQYLRLATPDQEGDPARDPLQLPDDPVARLGILHSYPDWIIAVWLQQFGPSVTEDVCIALNQPPPIDLRVNLLQTSVAMVAMALQEAGIAIAPLPPLPQALRLLDRTGAIPKLPGFDQGWWTVQGASAQYVSHLLAPQSGEVIVDACAAPGGKTTHIAELMGDRGTIWACDRTPSRLKKLQENAERLGLTSIRIWTGDSRDIPHLIDQADRVLLDAPCSGLGTLNRHADARWRQTPDSVQELAQLQCELLQQAALWVKPGGILVYATCTLHPAENEAVIHAFLEHHPQWQIRPPESQPLFAHGLLPEGWIKLLPSSQGMDGFFMVRLQKIN